MFWELVIYIKYFHFLALITRKKRALSFAIQQAISRKHGGKGETDTPLLNARLVQMQREIKIALSQILNP